MSAVAVPTPMPQDGARAADRSTGSDDAAAAAESSGPAGDADLARPAVAPALAAAPAASAEAAPNPAPTAVVVLAVLAVVATLWWGARFLIPLAAGLMLAMLVEPAVGAVQRLVRPRALAAALTLAVVATAGAAGVAASGQLLLRMADRLPDAIRLAANNLGGVPSAAESTLRRAHEALRELDHAIGRRHADTKPNPPRAARRVAAVAAAGAASAPSLSEGATAVLAETAVNGSGRLLALAIDIGVIAFIAFFVLAGGGTLARRFVALWARPDHQRRAAAALRECARQVRRHALVLAVANLLVGIAAWAWFTIAGLGDALAWGAGAALLHVVPYLGMAVFSAFGSAEAYLVHGSVGAAAATALALVLLSTLIGTGVTAWMQGRAASMSPAAVFIGVVFWGALWGAWGLLLGPALIVVIKVAAEHHPRGARWARLLAD